MEIEKKQPEIAKKLCNIVRMVFYMMKRSNVKRKILVELNMLLKKGENAGKAISNLILHHHHHHYAALTCRSNDVVNTSFVSPRDYEFRCSNTPVYTKRKNHHHSQANELKLMHNVFSILSRRYDIVDASPLAALPRGARPFLAEEKEELQIGMDAEEFIKKFYRELKKQKPITALESP